jgi:fucose permease
MLILASAVIMAISLGVGSAQAEAVENARSYYGSDSSAMVWNVLAFVLGVLRQLCYVGAGVCVIFGAIRYGFELAYELEKSRNARAQPSKEQPKPIEPT